MCSEEPRQVHSLFLIDFHPFELSAADLFFYPGKSDCRGPGSPFPCLNIVRADRPGRAVPIDGRGSGLPPVPYQPGTPPAPPGRCAPGPRNCQGGKGCITVSQRTASCHRLRTWTLLHRTQVQPEDLPPPGQGGEPHSSPIKRMAAARPKDFVFRMDPQFYGPAEARDRPPGYLFRVPASAPSTARVCTA